MQRSESEERYYEDVRNILNNSYNNNQEKTHNNSQKSKDNNIQN